MELRGPLNLLTNEPFLRGAQLHPDLPRGWLLLKNGTAYHPKPEVKLNRSRKWRPAQSYSQAREQSPSARPVR